MNKHISTLTVLIASCLFLHLSASQRCKRLDQCRCETLDGSGIIDLNSLALPADVAPRWTLEDADGWEYLYNPCIGFDSKAFVNLAALKRSDESIYEYDIGTQAFEDFSYSLTAGLAITYGSSTLSTTNVYLICTPSLSEHKLQFIGEAPSLESIYNFILESPCACPGMCDASGIIEPGSGTTPDSNQDMTSTAPDEETTSCNSPDTTPLPTDTTTIPSDTTQDQTTKASGNTTDSGDSCNKNSFSFWDSVEADIVSLLLHDMILVFVIVCAILVMKFVFKKRLAFFVDDGDISFRPQESAQAASNHESANRTEAMKTFNIAPAPDMNFHNIENVYSD